MAVVAVTSTGAALGWGIVVLLALLGVSRSLASIASKDVLAKTVPRGRRGLGAPVWGRFADRSSRWLMAWSGWVGAAIIVAVLVATRFDGAARSAWLSPPPIST